MTTDDSPASATFTRTVAAIDLRHTAIENMVASGVPMDVLHVLAGHANVRTRIRYYSKPSDERRRAAVDSVGKWLSERAVAK